MEDKQRKYIINNHKFALTSSLNHQAQAVFTIKLTALLIIAAFSLGIYGLVKGEYWQTIIFLLLALLEYFQLRKSINNLRSLIHQSINLKTSFIDNFPDMENEEIKDLHSKIKT